MSENTKKITENKEIKTETKKEKGEKKVKLNISKKKLAIIITASVVALALIVLAIVLIVNAVRRDVGFNYLKSDLSKYIEFSQDYKDFEVNIDIAKPRDIDVDVAILNMITKDKSEKPLYNGNYVTSAITVTPGDVLLIWYRGYLLGEDGEEIVVSGMSNFTGTEPSELEIGSNSFVPGFEYNLVGVNTGDYNKFNKITEGKGKESYVAYVSYTRTDLGTTSTKVTVSNERIDLSEDIDAEYGEGFKSKLLALAVGEKGTINAQTADKTYSYTDVTIAFFTDCEDNPIKIECYFPYDYSKEELRNENAIFEVYVEKAKIYDTPEFNDEYIQKKIEDKDFTFTLEELNGYEGANLVEKYRSYAKKVMMDAYEAEYKTLLNEAIWEHYASSAKVIKYPIAKLDKVYEEYVAELKVQYDRDGGKVYNSYTGQYTTYDSFDTYAPAYLGVTNYTDWRTYVYVQAMSYVKERMTLYYILRAENLVPDKSAFEAKVKETRQEYIDGYVQQYLDYESKTKDDYTEDEYNKMVEERTAEILSYYNDEYFEERAYYAILSENCIDWPKVVTLDERRAYPVDK